MILSDAEILPISQLQT